MHWVSNQKHFKQGEGFAWYEFGQKQITSLELEFILALRKAGVFPAAINTYTINQLVHIENKLLMVDNANSSEYLI